MDDYDGSTARLNEVFELCVKHKVKRLKLEDIEVEFEEQPKVIALDDDQIRNEVSKFRRVAEDEQKDFEKTLYHSA